MSYLERTLAGALRQASALFPVVLVTGARQVGKTTFLQHMAVPGRRYVTLDDPLDLALAKEDPVLFFKRHKPPIFIDEIQYAPALLRFIKKEVDASRQPGQYWLSGSQPFHMMQGVSESLTGRMAVLDLLGLSQWEIRGHSALSTPFLPGDTMLEKKSHAVPLLSPESIYAAIWRGAFPFAHGINDPLERQLFYRGYLKTYLERDVRDLAQVGDGSAFLRFLTVAAARTGQLLNMADMARDVGISPVQCKQWLSILQTSGVVYLLEPYHHNLNKRLVKAPKLYFIDTGLCAFLTRWSDPGTLENGAMSGAILETYVVMEILKSYSHNGVEPSLYFYRDKDKKEIDLLVEKDQTLYPIEIKQTASPSQQMVKHFRLISQLNKSIGQGALICLSDTLRPLCDGVDVVPVGLV